MRRTLLAFLFLAVPGSALAQEVDDLDKPIATSCDPQAAEGVPEARLSIELDEPIDLANPSLGFYPSAPGTVDVRKSGSETCNDGSARTAEEPYEKTDDASRLLAPCAFPSSLTLQAGVHDNFALPFDPANLTPAIMAAAGVPNPARWVAFDANRVNAHFGHQFQPVFQSLFGYQSGKLTLHIRPLGDIFTNDTLSLWATNAAAGWGAPLSSLGYRLAAGQDAVIELDLRKLRSGNSNVLADINQFGDLNVYMQDDTAIDDMTLTLSCSNSAIPTPWVGVVRGPQGCGTLPAYDVFFDNEDNRNANNRGGWIGAIESNKNTLLRLCGVDGRLFIPAQLEGAGFAVVSLAPNCPEGFTRFDRFHDNEDNRPASWDNAPSGSPTYTVQPEKNTNMAFCVATGVTSGVSNSTFPTLGVSYGVFGGRSPKISSWALDRGFIFMDDEDRRNRNQPANPPGYTYEFLTAGSNTTYYLARVK